MNRGVIVTLLCLNWLFIPFTVNAQHNRLKQTTSEMMPARKINIDQELKDFDYGGDSAQWSVTLCADVPNNARPSKVTSQGETGHVFLVLKKINVGDDTVSKVFGFYPKSGGLPAIFTKNVKSCVKDNSGRQYDASISLELTKEQFGRLLDKVTELSKKRYHLNRFNCYDFALQAFNSVAGSDSLETHYVRFPFIFGRGGSPCSVYEELVKTGLTSPLSYVRIRISTLQAPQSSVNRNQYRSDPSGTTGNGMR